MNGNCATHSLSSSAAAAPPIAIAMNSDDSLIQAMPDWLAFVHRDGTAFSATWSRATPYDPYEFFDSATGQQVPLDVGTTFIELARPS